MTVDPRTLAADPLGWWHHNVNAGKIHDHPANPGRAWSHAMHRLCEQVYPKVTVESCVLTDAGLDWLRQYFVDTYNEDWASPYQFELIGEVPDDVLRWADADPSKRSTAERRGLRVIGGTR